MQKKQVHFVKLHPLAVQPVYATAHSSMADLSALVHHYSGRDYDSMIIEPGSTKVVRTGLAMQPEPGFGIKVYPRSGLANKCSITLQNAVGVIDRDYPDELILLVRNEGHDPFVVSNGMRIAQMEVHPVIQAEFSEVAQLPAIALAPSEVARTGGFGSTGHQQLDAAPLLADPQTRSKELGGALVKFGEMLMECSIESTTGVTHNACEEVGNVLRALGENIAQGNALAVTHDVQHARVLAQAVTDHLKNL